MSGTRNACPAQLRRVRMLFSVLIFSVLIAFISFLISKRHNHYDRSELATYVVLIAWGSLLFGLFISNLSGNSIGFMALR
jgi:hypothetical protein